MSTIDVPHRPGDRGSAEPKRRKPRDRPLMIVVTDGRSQRRRHAIEAMQRLAKAAGVVVFDGEQGPVRLHLAAALAQAANARLLPLEALA